MSSSHSRRRFLGLATAGTLAPGLLPAGRRWAADGAVAPSAASAAPHADSQTAWGSAPRAVVSLVRGEERRRNACEALLAIEERILPVLKTKKVVVLKPNIVNSFNQLASSHVDALQGALDFFAPRFRGPIVVAESAAGSTQEGFTNFGYQRLISEHQPCEVSLVDLNAEGLYEPLSILDENLHPKTVRLAQRLLDPEAFIVNVTPLKTHNAAVATLSIKNMTLGAPLRSAPGVWPRWSDKRVYHGGVRQTHFDIFLTAQRMAPYWGATLIDGFEGMEGNGPNSGTPVPSRIAIASTDYVAADRIGIEAMGIDASWVGYLQFCAEVGLGVADLARIDVRGAKLDEVRRQYQLHKDIDRMLQWRGPLTELPPKLGWMGPVSPVDPAIEAALRA